MANPPYLQANSQFRYGFWTGRAYSAGHDSAPFAAYTSSDLAVTGYDDFDNTMSKPHDIAYEQAQVTLASQWDAASASQRLTLLINYFQSVATADLRFIADEPSHLPGNEWGLLLAAVAVPAFTASVATDLTIIYRLQNDAAYAAQMTGLTRQQMQARVGAVQDYAPDAIVYWLGLINDTAGAVGQAIVSLRDLVEALDHGDDFSDQMAALLGSGGSVSSVLDPMLQLLQNRSGAIHQIERASSTTGATAGNNNSYHPSVSGDGHYVAFMSYASNLVAADTNSASDIFLYNTQSQAVSRVSVGAGGAQANNQSSDPSITQDGRYIAFTSTATNLVQGDAAGWQEVFVTDGTATVRVSIGHNAQGGNEEPNFPSYHPSITLDSGGSNYLVAYASQASNLVAGDTNSSQDIFVYRSTSHAISRITNGNAGSDFPSISTGGTIAFESYASNLVSGDTNNRDDVFYYNGSSIVRVAPNGVQPNGDSGHASISADGKFIAFESLASNLVAGDTNGAWDIFVYDVTSRTIERISVGYDGTPANNDSFAPSISGDGRFVTFRTRAGNLVANQSSPADQIYVYDRELHTARLVSVSAAGEAGNSHSIAPAISADGSTVAFESGATNLFRGDNGFSDVFVTDALRFFTSGGPQNDIIGSASGNDILDGGRGSNTVSYAGIAAAVTVSLAVTGPQNTGGGGTDTLTNFANLIGGGGADRLTGDAIANSLNGGPSGDILNGLGGFDLLTGGTGNDRFVFDAIALADAKAAVPLIDEVTDYAAGDQLDLTALLSAAYHGSGQPAASFVRAVEDASGTFARLQIDTDGAANGANWVTIARLDGMQVGNVLNVVLDSAAPAGSSVNVVDVRTRMPVNDFNGDGKTDIVWRNDAGGLAIWAMNDGVIHHASSLGNMPANWKLAGTGDFNGDHMSDLLWRNDAGVVAIWDMNDGAILHANSLGAIPTNWHIIGTGDFNGDHMTDIVWRNDAGGTAIWDMNDGAILHASSLGTVPSNWTLAGTGDFTGEGMTDLLWRNDAGVTAIWAMNDGAIHHVSSLGAIPANWHIVGTGDFNGDHLSDIVWRNDAGVVAIWDMNDGAILAANSLGSVPSNWHLANTGDYNGDGKSDLLWRNDAGVTAIWDMNDGAILHANSLGSIPTNWHIIA
ncbi:MAG: FG-GAP-like repeat-containing protein [Bradyrhizobium sp.]